MEKYYLKNLLLEFDISDRYGSEYISGKQLKIIFNPIDDIERFVKNYELHLRDMENKNVSS